MVKWIVTIYETLTELETAELIDNTVIIHIILSSRIIVSNIC